MGEKWLVKDGEVSGKNWEKTHTQPVKLIDSSKFPGKKWMKYLKRKNIPSFIYGTLTTILEQVIISTDSFAFN